MNNTPTLSRLTGQTEQADRALSIRGLPPGAYRLEYKGGESYGGLHVQPDPPLDPSFAYLARMPGGASSRTFRWGQLAPLAWWRATTSWVTLATAAVTGTMRHLGAPQNFSPDRFGNGASALSLTGTQHVLLRNEAAFDLAEYSLVMIVTLPTPGFRDDFLINKHHAEFGNFGLRRSSGLSGMGLYGHDASAGQRVGVFSHTPFPQNLSVCLAVTVGQGTAHTYYDGVLQHQYSGVPSPSFNNEPVRIGLGGYTAPNTYLRGVIDDVIVFKGKVNQAQVQAACQ